MIVYRRSIYALVISFLYSAFLASLPTYEFKDRDNYANNYILSAQDLMSELFDGGVSGLIFGEPLFKVLNLLLSSVLTPEHIIKLYIFVPSLFLSYFVLKRPGRGFFFLVLMLFFPYIINKHIHHLRHSIAITLFVIGYLSEKKIIRRFLIGMSPFFHVGLFVPVVVIFARRIAGKRISSDLLFIVALFFVGLFLSSLLQLDFLSSNLSKTERYLSDDLHLGVGGAWVIWFIVLIVFISNGKDFIKRYVLEASSISFYLGSVIGFSYSLRFLEQVSWLIFLSSMKMGKIQRYIFICCMLTIWIYHWSSRWGIENFGY